MKKKDHSVVLSYGITKIRLKAKDLQLFADALEVINPDTEKQEKNARNWAAAFSALAEYAVSVK